MSARFFALAFLGLSIVVSARAQTTPKPGSAERQAICDGARAHLMSKYVSGALRQAVVFKIDHLLVADGYANMEAIPIYKDGSNISPELLPDIGYNFCLQRTGSGWRVIADLSRSDVPSTAEAAAIKQRLPQDFPRAVLSTGWQQLLGR